MRCPFCESKDTKVIDSRHINNAKSIRRRRECESCLKRFTTYEQVEVAIIMVVKKDGSREAFDRNKMMSGLIRAFEKRPVTRETIENIVAEIEFGISNMLEKEVESKFIGELLMEKIKEVDEVAYVRFASVYRQFTDLNTFIREIEELLKKKAKI